MRISWVLAPLLAVAAQAEITIRGTLLDENDAPLSGVTVVAQDIRREQIFTPDAPRTTTDANGAFTLFADAKLYVLIADPSPPRPQARLRVDARGGTSINGLILRSRLGDAEWPDRPPHASLITIGAPDALYRTRVTGAPGSVVPNSVVMLILLDTGLIETTDANPDGSFALTMFAPAGASLMIKSDPDGLTAWRESSARSGIWAGALAGTILRVPDPLSSGGRTAFTSTGIWEERTPPVWVCSGTVDRTTLARGESLNVQATLTLLSPALKETMTIRAYLGFQKLSWPDGAPALGHSVLASTTLTPTGLPIERVAPSYRRFEANAVTFTVAKTASDRAHGTFTIAGRIPSDYSEGHYLPVLEFDFQDVPPEQPSTQRLLTVDHLRTRIRRAHLPSVRFGNPSPPRIAWTLLTDTLSGGARGVSALEDREGFALSPRIVTQSDTLIVPRLDARTGRAIRYRLEPFAPSISRGDRHPPSTPLIPFRFPSGSLSVRVQRPNGFVFTIGPAPFTQSRMQSLVHRDGGDLDRGGGSLTEPYQLSTMNPSFEIEFSEDGVHTITLEGQIDDVWGTRWSGKGTYEVYVAQPLAFDTAVLPGTPFVVGDRFHAGLQTLPGMPADVEVRVTVAPSSDRSRMTTTILRGRSSDYGFFLPDRPYVFDTPGEYRVDIKVIRVEPAGRHWAASRTYGGVIVPIVEAIIAHGRRGIDKQPSPRPAWFTRETPDPSSHVFPPFHSGDVVWQVKNDAQRLDVTVQDPEGVTLGAMGARVPFYVGNEFEERATQGELPLFSNSTDDTDPSIDPARVELWGYGYRSVQRPSIRVRELVAEDQIQSPYWRFEESYARQPGAGANGDLPNDFKFQFGSAVLRGPAIGQPRYAAHSSLFVLVPDDDSRGTRVFPPFQGNGGGPTGGPLFTFKGKAIDLFFHPTALRPGTILERGQTATFAGYAAPPLPVRIEIATTSPSGVVRTIHGLASRIGYWSGSSQDFVVDEPGVWKAKVKITFDGVLPSTSGQMTPPYPVGDVLGSREGEFYFYVVEPSAPAAEIESAPRFVRPADGPIAFTVLPPTSLANVEMYYTTTMPGFVLEEGRSSTLTYVYDAANLSRDFPNLDLHDPDGFAGVDTITISLLIRGTDLAGAERHFARQIILQGEAVQLSSRRATGRRRGARR